MVNTVNLDLDLDERRDASPAARVCVVQACSYTRGVGAPTITEDCKTFREFEREVARLKAELDAVLAAAKTHFGAPAGPVDSSKEDLRGAGVDSPETDGSEASLARLDGGDVCVEDLMTRNVKTLAPNDKIAVIDELMKVGNFRHVVVVEDDGTVVGVVSHRDIVFSALDWNMGQGRRAHDLALETFTAKHVMQSSVVGIDPDAPLSEAAKLMQNRKIGCLPVLRDKKLVGILTEGDILAALSQA